MLQLWEQACWVSWPFCCEHPTCSSLLLFFFSFSVNTLFVLPFFFFSFETFQLYTNDIVVEDTIYAVCSLFFKEYRAISYVVISLHSLSPSMGTSTPKISRGATLGVKMEPRTTLGRLSQKTLEKKCEPRFLSAPGRCIISHVMKHKHKYHISASNLMM